MKNSFSKSKQNRCFTSSWAVLHQFSLVYRKFRSVSRELKENKNVLIWYLIKQMWETQEQESQYFPAKSQLKLIYKTAVKGQLLPSQGLNSCRYVFHRFQQIQSYHLAMGLKKRFLLERQRPTSAASVSWPPPPPPLPCATRYSKIFNEYTEVV